MVRSFCAQGDAEGHYREAQRGARRGAVGAHQLRCPISAPTIKPPKNRKPPRKYSTGPRSGTRGRCASLATIPPVEGMRVRFAVIGNIAPKPPCSRRRQRIRQEGSLGWCVSADPNIRPIFSHDCWQFVWTVGVESIVAQGHKREELKSLSEDELLRRADGGAPCRAPKPSVVF
jgi:hypothetical protein